MSANVEPHEARAILDAVRPAVPSAAPPAVEPRDFARPMRLSPRALGELQRRVQALMPECEQALSRALRAECSLELSELSEVSAEGLFDELAAPFAVARFEAGGQIGWVRWDLRGAVAAVECVLGMPAGEAQARKLSAVERRILSQLIEPLARALAKGLGSDLGGLRVAEDPEQVGSWSEGGRGADRARLRLHLVCTGPGGECGIDLWLPGGTAVEDSRAIAPQELPRCLDEVAVSISARLGSRDVPLSELLAIEAGDVIPLATAVGGCLDVLAEDVPCARARLGRSAGRIALWIAEVGPADREES